MTPIDAFIHEKAWVWLS